MTLQDNKNTITIIIGTPGKKSILVHGVPRLIKGYVDSTTMSKINPETTRFFFDNKMTTIGEHINPTGMPYNTPTRSESMNQIEKEKGASQ